MRHWPACTDPTALRSLVILGFIWANVATCDKAMAGEYALTEGDGLAVCEAYRRNFEPRHDLEPIACERQCNPTIPGFSAVPWRRLDLGEHFDLYREAQINLATNVDGGRGIAMSQQDALAMTKALEPKTQYLHVELYVARLPLLGAAHPVNVLSIRELPCGAIPKTDVKISRLFVLNSMLTHIDPREQKRLQRWGNDAAAAMYDGTPYLENMIKEDSSASARSHSTLHRWRSEITFPIAVIHDRQKGVRSRPVIQELVRVPLEKAAKLAPNSRSAYRKMAT